MAVKGAYVAHVSCDGGVPHEGLYWPDGWPAGTACKYTGATVGACIAKARLDGWTISTRKVLCPWCAGKTPRAVTGRQT